MSLLAVADPAAATEVGFLLLAVVSAIITFVVLPLLPLWFGYNIQTGDRGRGDRYGGVAILGWLGLCALATALLAKDAAGIIPGLVGVVSLPVLLGYAIGTLFSAVGLKR